MAVDNVGEEVNSTNDISFQYVLLDNGAKCPIRATPRSAGFDVYSPINYNILPHETAKIPLYIAIKPPLGMYVRITSRSGLAVANKVFTCADVVDPDYVGGIHICLFNASNVEYHVYQNDRIGSIVFEKYGVPYGRQVRTLGSTDRGTGGFGSTGI